MKYIPLTSFVLFLLAAGSASASVVNYSCAETNGSFTTDCGIGESQFITTVSDNGNSATFRFRNIGEEDSVISNIYFDDTTSVLLNFATVAVDDGYNGALENLGVFFTEGPGGDPVGADPGDLPGAVDFDVSFAIGRQKQGGIGRGINNDTDKPETEPMWAWEILEITANYAAGSTFALLSAALDSGAFSIGLKGQAFEDGGSEWFTSTTTTTVVPVPAAFWLFGTALIGFIGISRRTKV